MRDAQQSTAALAACVRRIAERRAEYRPADDQAGVLPDTDEQFAGTLDLDQELDATFQQHVERDGAIMLTGDQGIVLEFDNGRGLGEILEDLAPQAREEGQLLECV